MVDAGMDDGSLGSPIFRPAKLPKFDWKHCLCHSGAVSREPLVEFTVRSWKTLLNAASVRDDHLNSFLCKNGVEPDVPRGFYHRACYEKYTHKQHLARLTGALEKSEGSDPAVARSSSQVNIDDG